MKIARATLELPLALAEGSGVRETDMSMTLMMQGRAKAMSVTSIDQLQQNKKGELAFAFR